MSEPNLIGNEKKYLSECVKTNWISSQGKFLNKFRNKISKITKSKDTVLTSSGSSALHASLLALGVKKDEIVIAPSFTFVATINSISLVGAKPWLFDVDLIDLNIDLNLLEKELEENCKINSKGQCIHLKKNKKVSAIMVVYSFGLIANIIKLKKISKKFKIPVIADAACSLGSKYNNKAIGEIGIDISTISFNGNKAMTCGSGGAIISNNSEYLKKAHYYCSNAREKYEYTYNDIGFNYRMNNLQAAVGLAQIENINFFINKKNKIKNFYKKNIKLENKNISFLPEKKNFLSTCWFSGLLFNNSIRANRFRKFLEKNNIESRKFWKPMHLQKPYSKVLKTKMTNSNKIWEKIITLPSGTNLSVKKLEYIAKVSNLFLKLR